MSFTKAKKIPTSSPSNTSSTSTSSIIPSTSSYSSLVSTKPYLNGQSMVSYGNKDLDEILHGGHLLGTVTLLASDSYTNYSDIFLSYEINEAIIHQHKILIISPSQQEAMELINSLPMNLNKNSNFHNQSESQQSTSDGLSVEEKMKLLKNAWQYGKYIKDPPTTNTANSYCSSYDLSQKLQKEILEANYPRVFCPIDGNTSDLFDSQATTTLIPLSVFLQSILTAVASFQKVYATTNSPLRIFFHRFGGITSRGYNFESIESKRLVNQFAVRLKQLISRPSPLHSVPQSTLTITIQKDLQQPHFYRMIESILADTYLSLDSFSGKAESIPIEYRYFCGFLYIHKVQQLGSMIPYRPSAAQYGLKRDRRKLHVELLHLPPEDSRASKYHPEAGNAPSQSTPTMKSSSMDSSIPSLQKPPSVVGRVENKSKLGSLCSPQISSRLDF